MSEPTGPGTTGLVAAEPAQRDHCTASRPLKTRHIKRALTPYVREIGAERKAMLCAFGIHEGEKTEILSSRMADSEDLSSWKGFLADLKAQGLLGKKIKLIASDGNPAFLEAIGEIHPFRKGRRCVA